MKSEHSEFNPDVLLDSVMRKLCLKNDAALARRLQFSYPYISKVRRRRSPVTAGLLISMQEETGLSIRELRLLSGDFRDHTGKSARIVPPGTTAVC